jgi:two-component system, cell cycle response regulator DivK
VTSNPPSPLVLIVDDNEKNLKLARDVLRAAGFHTLEAANGREAITVALSQLPDLVLLDLRLPDMDGMAVARELAAEPRTAGIPLIALTALEPEPERLRAAGFTDHLSKPIDVVTFPSDVRRYCGKRDASTPRRNKRAG